MLNWMEENPEQDRASDERYRANLARVDATLERMRRLVRLYDDIFFAGERADTMIGSGGTRAVVGTRGRRDKPAGTASPTSYVRPRGAA